MSKPETSATINSAVPEAPAHLEGKGERQHAALPGGGFLVAPAVAPLFTRELFTPEQREIEKMVQDFAEERILPQREELGKVNRELSLALLREVGELGLTGIDVPEEYGGLGLDKTTSALVVETLTRGGSASWIVTFSAHVGIGTLPIVFFGTEEQKARFLPKLASGEWVGAYALTEAEAGSDAGSLKTTAVPTEDGEGFVLDGLKQYITNGAWADLFVIFARLEGHGVTAFLVERDRPGVTPGAEERKLGIKGSSTTSLALQGVRIPKENLLGRPGKGMTIALDILNVGRFKLGAADLGGCKRSVELAANYALERLQFGQPVAYFEAVRSKLADMVVRTFLLDAAIYRTVGLLDARIGTLDHTSPDYPLRVAEVLEEYAVECSIGKVLGSETMDKLADHGVQIYGGNGFSEEYPFAELYRDTRIDRIFEGTNEINRAVIIGYLLKKALTEELPLREAVRARPVAGSGALAWEVDALENLRGLTLELLFDAVSLYGQDLRNAQMVGEELADLVIACFAGGAAIGRIQQLDARSREDRVVRAVARLAVATCLEDAWRAVYRLRPTLYADAYGKSRREDLDRRLAALQLPFDPVQEVKVVTDDLFEHRGYRFDP